MGSKKPVVAGQAAARPCPFDVEVLKDQYGRNQTFGSGAWSTVYKATTYSRTEIHAGLPSPPASPKLSLPVLVAVKRPLNKDAITIIESEAKILSFISTVDGCEDYVVPFYGIDTRDSSLVLAAVPLSFDHYITRCAQNSAQNLSTRNMTEPVIGSTGVWLDLAYQMISALDWLHNEAGVVHGDIKPGNILLSQNSTPLSPFPYRPLFADFSSSQLLDAPEPTPNTLSAVTREYTAPELLSSAVLRNPKSMATTASDVFSLAVTLLVAATGDTMVYSGSMFQRQAMATQGWHVLSHVRNGEQGSRVPRQGVVERTLERAVLKAGMGRISAERWKDVVEQMVRGEPTKL